MSESLLSKSHSNIILFSANGGLQTGLLARFVSEELSLQCDCYQSLKDVPEYRGLLLIDCHGQSIDFLTHAAEDIHKRLPDASAALINAEHESEHENLLDWPCISGLFYVDTEQDQLIRGLKCLIEGDYWVPRRLLHHFLDRNRKTPTSSHLSDVNLTKRERQILKLIKEGATNADISESLKVSEHTVKSHLYNVYKKIDVRNRLEASNWVSGLSDANLLG